MKKVIILAMVCLLFTFSKSYATDGYVKVTSSNNTVSWVKIKVEYKYNGNEYKVSSNAIDRNTEGAVDLDNVWSESGGTGKQYKIIELDYCAFYDCSKITSVSGSSTSFVSIYGQAFEGCTSLKSVYIPYAQSLGSYAFAYCSSLTSVTLDRIYRIDSGAFHYCSALTSFNIGSSVRIIEGNPFQGCTSLTNLTIASSNTYFTIDNGVIYSKDLTTLQSYLPAKAGTSFYVPTTVTRIGESAFSGNRTLSAVIMRNGVQTIGASAFNNTNIQSVYLPGSITTIGNSAFYNSNKLNSVKTASSVPITISSNVFSNAGKATLYVPQGSKDAYEDAENWKTFSSIEEYSNGNIITFANSTVKEICVSNWDLNGDGELDENEAKEVKELSTQFQNNTEITTFDELQYFTNLQTIAASAFSGCTNLSSVIVPSSVTEIGYNAFYNTAWLNAQPDGLLYIGKVLYVYKGTMPENTKIVVNDGTTSICDYAFNNQTGLIEIELPNSLISIGSELEGYVFNGCTGLTAIKIPAGVKNIERYTFSSSGLKTIELPEGLESIGNSSFRSCTNLESIVIPNRVTSIGKNAFRSCSKLKSVTMPYSLETVATDAFRDCSQLQAVYIPNLENWIQISFEDYRANPLTYGHHLFLNNEEVIDLLIPMASSYGYSGSEIHYYPSAINSLAFYGCSYLKTVSIPKSISSIGNNAFEGCTALTAVKVESAPFELNSYAFPTRTNVTLYTPQTYINQYQTANVWNTFKAFRSYPSVDVNCDENVDVVDVVDIVRYTKGNPSDSFDQFLADLNADRVIDLNDAKQDLNAVSYSTVLTTIPPETGEQSNTVKVGNFEVRARKTCVASIILENTSDRLVGFQMDITMPEGLSLTSNMCRLSNRIADEEQQLTVSDLGNNTYRFTSVSLSLQPISGNNGELITMFFDATKLTASGNITVSNIRFVTDNSERIVMPNDEFEIQPIEYLQFLAGDGTENNPYLILDPNDFINLANDVNGGTSYEGYFFKVAKSEIDFANVNYVPIGIISKINDTGTSPYYLGNPFKGTFDGNGVIIKKLSSNNGLFKNLGKSGVVKNIIIDETCIISGGGNVGAIAGVSEGEIFNCINRADISSTGYHIGGICGDNMGSIVNCKNYGTITGVKIDYDSTSGSMMGGIAGDLDGGKLQNCENYGTVSGISMDVGGIVGLVCGNNSLIDGCTNKGDVIGTYRVGGIFGNGSLTATVSDNLVTGCVINGTYNYNPMGAGAIGNESRGLSYNYYTIDVIVKVGDKTYEGFAARGICDYLGGRNITENDGAMLKFSFEEYLTPYADNSYEIQSVNDIKTMNNFIQEVGLTLEGITFKVTTSELDFESQAFMVGRYCEQDQTTYKEDYRPFAGTFDGNGVVMKNLIFNDSTDAYWRCGIGLFAYNKGTVKNVVLDESCKMIATRSMYLGGMVAVNEGTIAECVNNATISGASYSGGIAGKNSNNIQACVNNGFVHGSNSVGGICGQNSGAISICKNLNEISVGTDYMGGGIAGQNSGIVTGCINEGSITGIRSPYIYYVDKNKYIGGILGNNTGEAKDNIVLGCEFTYASGAIVGTNNGTLQNNLYSTSVRGINKGSFDGDVTEEYGAVRAYTIKGGNNVIVKNVPIVGNGILYYDGTTYFAGGLTVDIELEYDGEVPAGYEVKYTSNAVVELNDNGGYSVTVQDKDIIIEAYLEEQVFETVPVGNALVAGYSSDKALDFTGTDVTAWIATGFRDGKILLSKVDVVPANTGIYVKSTKAGEFDIPTTTEKAYYVNMFQPVVTAKTVQPTETVDGVTYQTLSFALSQSTGQPAFFPNTAEKTYGDNKMYLRLPEWVLDGAARLMDNGEWIMDKRGEVTDVLTGDTEPVTIGTLGVAGFSSNRNLDFTNSDVEAWIATGFKGGNVMLSRVYAVPAGTGVYVKSKKTLTQQTTFQIPVTTELPYYVNAFVGLPDGGTVHPTETVGGVTMQTLSFAKSQSTGKPAFFPNTADKTYGAGKMYLRLPADLVNSSDAARGLNFVFEGDELAVMGETTGISEASPLNDKGQMINGSTGSPQDKRGGVYNLNGQRVQTSNFKVQTSKLKKGLYIVNGKKVVIK